MKNKKISVIMVGYLNQAPPALTFIQALSESGYDVSVYAAGQNSQDDFKGYNFSNVKFENVIGDYNSSISLPRKLIRLVNIRKRIWNALSSVEHKGDLIVAISEVTIKHLGEALLKRRYIYYQLELIKNICYIPHLEFWKINVEKIAANAQKVIVCEYNRAHITKAWWKMQYLPEVIMNKPFVPYLDMNNLPTDITEKISFINKKAAGRNIVLYQGVLSKQRPIEPFIKAVELNKEKYCFVLLSSGKPTIDVSEGTLIHIPFVEPPYHLAITSMAKIGVLAYNSGGNSSYSELNPIYCAPNKVWEYARFGVPMVSNDLPGLRLEFEMNKIGICCSNLSPSKILSCYDSIQENYENMANNAINYYNSYDVRNEIIRIIKSV